MEGESLEGEALLLEKVLILKGESLALERDRQVLQRHWIFHLLISLQDYIDRPSITEEDLELVLHCPPDPESGPKSNLKVLQI